MTEDPPLILVVDDEPLSRDALSRRLIRRKFAVDTLDCGAALLRYLEHKRPTLILMDVSMPHMSGIETLKKIRLKWGQDSLPVILVSAMSDSEDVISGLEAGANDFVVKPVNLPVLIARIRVCLVAHAAVLARDKAEQSLRLSEEQLRQANNDLDRRVRERTEELARSNRLLMEEVAERKKAAELLLAHQEKLRALAAQVSVAEEQERRRIARGLHDHIGQVLALAKMKLDTSGESAADTPASQARNEIRPLLEQAIRHVRSLTFELGSRVLYEFGLDAALENLTEQLSAQHGIHASFEGDDLSNPLDEDALVALFQGARELLHNVVKHAQAKSVKVVLARDQDAVRLTVSDDGVGCQFEQASSALSASAGFGLFSLRERLEYIGGRMIVTSRPGLGTSATLWAPVKASISQTEPKCQ